MRIQAPGSHKPRTPSLKSFRWLLTTLFFTVHPTLLHMHRCDASVYGTELQGETFTCRHVFLLQHNLLHCTLLWYLTHIYRHICEKYSELSPGTSQRGGCCSRTRRRIGRHSWCPLPPSILSSIGTHHEPLSCWCVIAVAKPAPKEKLSLQEVCNGASVAPVAHVSTL